MSLSMLGPSKILNRRDSKPDTIYEMAPMPQANKLDF
jgi:hypothetical protein